MFFSPPFLHFQSSTLCSVVYPYAATPSSSFSAFGRSWRFQQHSDFQRLQCFRQQSDRSEAVAVSLSLSSLAAAIYKSGSVFYSTTRNPSSLRPGSDPSSFPAASTDFSGLFWMFFSPPFLHFQSSTLCSVVYPYAATPSSSFSAFGRSWRFQQHSDFQQLQCFRQQSDRSEAVAVSLSLSSLAAAIYKSGSVFYSTTRNPSSPRPGSDPSSFPAASTDFTGLFWMFFSPPFLHFQSSTLCSVVYPYAATPSSSFSAFGRSWRFQQHSDFQRLQCFRQQSDRSEAVAVSLSLSSLAAAIYKSGSVFFSTTRNPSSLRPGSDPSSFPAASTDFTGLFWMFFSPPFLHFQSSTLCSVVYPYAATPSSSFSAFGRSWRFQQHSDFQQLQCFRQQSDRSEAVAVSLSLSSLAAAIYKSGSVFYSTTRNPSSPRPGSDPSSFPAASTDFTGLFWMFFSPPFLHFQSSTLCSVVYPYAATPSSSFSAFGRSWRFQQHSDFQRLQCFRQQSDRSEAVAVSLSLSSLAAAIYKSGSVFYCTTRNPSSLRPGSDPSSFPAASTDFTGLFWMFFSPPFLHFQSSTLCSVVYPYAATPSSSFSAFGRSWRFQQHSDFQRLQCFRQQSDRSEAVAVSLSLSSLAAAIYKSGSVFYSTTRNPSSLRPGSDPSSFPAASTDFTGLFWMFFSPPFLHFQSSTLCSVVYPYAATPSSSFSAFGRSWRFQQHSDFQQLQCFRQQSDRSEAVAVSLSLSSLAAAIYKSGSVFYSTTRNPSSLRPGSDPSSFPAASTDFTGLFWMFFSPPFLHFQSSTLCSVVYPYAATPSSSFSAFCRSWRFQQHSDFQRLQCFRQQSDRSEAVAVSLSLSSLAVAEALFNSDRFIKNTPKNRMKNETYKRCVEKSIHHVLEDEIYKHLHWNKNGGIPCCNVLLLSMLCWLLSLPTNGIHIYLISSIQQLIF
ncbi:hypothetical protein LXL04_027650 [Taraxacum kok-saghyz]